MDANVVGTRAWRANLRGVSMRIRSSTCGRAAGSSDSGLSKRHAGWVALMSMIVPAAVLAGTPSAQRTFASPEAAVEALVAADRGNDLDALINILGPGGQKLVHSGDPVADAAGRERFVTAFEASHRIDLDGEEKANLVIGKEEWPLPIPLVRTSAGWRFDTEAGEQEILNRRIGRNELSVIAVCRAYVQAQREYALLATGAGGKPEYAQRFTSHEGQRDGLYWPTPPGGKVSPLGPLMEQARAAGYAGGAAAAVGAAPTKPQPYHGYFYRILTRQGPHAPGGPKDYVVGGHMLGGFALLAYPAVYGDSGIKTFIVNQDGIVFEKDLGPTTSRLVGSLEQYDPDASWHAP